MISDPVSTALLQIAYVVDILASVPVVFIALAGNQTTIRWLFGESFCESQSTRTLLGALWLAILFCLVVGVLFPIVMSPILILQLIYKSLWVILFAVPRWLRGRGEEVPGKVAGIFLAFILVYPWLIPWNNLFTAR